MIMRLHLIIPSSRVGLILTHQADWFEQGNTFEAVNYLSTCVVSSRLCALVALNCKTCDCNAIAQLFLHVYRSIMNGQGAPFHNERNKIVMICCERLRRVLTIKPTQSCKVNAMPTLII